MIKKVLNRLPQIATVLTLFLVFYFFYTYNYEKDISYNPGVGGVYEGDER